MFAHNQTYCNPPNQPIQTNWSIATNNGVTIVPTYSYNGFYAPAKVGNSLAYFNSTSTTNANYITYNNTIPIIWTNQWTIEFWMVTGTAFVSNSWTPLTVGIQDSYHYALTFNSNVVFDGGTGANNYVTTELVDSGNTGFTFGGGSVATTKLSPPTFYYFTVVQENYESRKFYINGNLVATETGAIDLTPNTTSSFALKLNNAAGAWSGGLDQIRISNIARYTSNFTPPTTAFTNDVNTWFLCSFDNGFTPAPSPT